MLTSRLDREVVASKWRFYVLGGDILTEDKLYQQFEEYYKAKRVYVSYVFDDILSFLITGSSYILVYRKALFSRIKLLTTLP